tara:strand:- start:424 stop:867 length:444 start_codon:yes stop_codon:yes gene_type:complete
MLTFLSSAVGGSILGGVLSITQKIVDAKSQAWQAEIDIKKMESISRLKITEAEFKSFDSSLQNTSKDVVIPENAPIWVVSARVMIDAFRSFTRPGLTWCMVFALILFIVAGFVGEAAVAAILSDFVFTTSTAVMWWFGSRPVQRTAK